jgi:hypothetical protein
MVDALFKKRDLIVERSDGCFCAASSNVGKVIYVGSHDYSAVLCQTVIWIHLVVWLQ